MYVISERERHSDRRSIFNFASDRSSIFNVSSDRSSIFNFASCANVAYSCSIGFSLLARLVEIWGCTWICKRVHNNVFGVQRLTNTGIEFCGRLTLKDFNGCSTATLFLVWIASMLGIVYQYTYHEQWVIMVYWLYSYALSEVDIAWKKIMPNIYAPLCRYFEGAHVKYYWLVNLLIGWLID